MTDRWDRLAALEQAATPGPWRQGHGQASRWLYTGTTGGTVVAGPIHVDADAAFIAEMRNALPDLLRERAELRAALGDGLRPVKFSEADPSVVILRQCDTFEWRERVRAALAGDRTPAP